ncbi:MAG: FtsQ-type POTRA domain-containing protein [bacterium]|nr:FtsQ-type POTRA domain-containing protein [bacterium]
MKPKGRPLVLRKGFWMFILALIVACFVAYALFFSAFFRVQEIRVLGAETLSADALREKVVFRDIPFVPSTNILLFDGEATVKGIEETFPKVREVRVRRIFPSTIKIQAVERRESLVWCQSQCFAVDETGIAFEEREGPGALTAYKEGGEAELRQRVLSPESISLVLQFSESIEGVPEVREAGITLPSFKVLSEETVIALTSEGWEIYLSLQEDAAWQTAKFGAVFQRELTAERRKALEYVDVRFGDQAYVK